MSGNYVNTIYNLKERPKTDYPEQLAAYLIHRYHIGGGRYIRQWQWESGFFQSVRQSRAAYMGN